MVFIKEIVPKRILTFVANTIYKEKYETLPMSHKWESKDDSLLVQYQWKKAGKLNSFSAHTDLNLFDIKEGSEEEFITEHFWGYTKISDNLTAEYEVQHPRWQVYPVKEYQIYVEFDKVYGHDFEFLNHKSHHLYHWFYRFTNFR